jgi:hypothetical protein
LPELWKTSIAAAESGVKNYVMVYEMFGDIAVAITPSTQGWIDPERRVRGASNNI